jgi:hypothetical protein
MRLSILSSVSRPPFYNLFPPRFNRKPVSSVTVETRLLTKWRKNLVSIQGRGKRCFCYPQRSVGHRVHPGVKWPKCEAKHSLASTADIKNAWKYSSARKLVSCLPARLHFDTEDGSQFLRNVDRHLPKSMTSNARIKKFSSGVHNFLSYILLSRFYFILFFLSFVIFIHEDETERDPSMGVNMSGQ